MTATALGVSTLVFADPSLYSGPQLAEQFSRLNSTLGFAWALGQSITTLSVNSVIQGAQVGGLTYTPQLASSDPCVNASAPYVPQNVTRQADLPATANLVAVVPWISPQCTKNYLSSARADGVNGVIVFLTDPNYAGGTPPANSPAWDLGDGGQWKQENPYPVYAVPPASGNLLMLESALYSGNMTSVPHGQTLTGLYDSRDYVRLFLVIATASSSGLPSLWVFLLIIVSVLLLIVGTISLMMHLLQRRRREILRRRVASGDVNLEALGIKRMTVPQEILDKMPVYVFEKSEEPAENQSATSSGQVAGVVTNPKKPRTTSIDLAKGKQPIRSHFDQPTCAICLDDFEHGETNVRQLPCEHIFHPECVDEFLRDNSSLCPLCKASALPKGYCPTTITNAMVRRERVIRRLRSDAERGGSINSQALENPLPTRNPFARSRSTGNASSDVELAQRGNAVNTPAQSSSDPVVTSAEDVEVNPDPGPAPASNSRTARREWARRRALAMLGQRPLPEADDPALATRPRWRKFIDKVFPRAA
ncbi:hypothetical protein MBLNU457_1860t1 [Dothideomycetes sp. NU457]